MGCSHDLINILCYLQHFWSLTSGLYNCPHVADKPKRLGICFATSGLSSSIRNTQFASCRFVYYSFEVSWKWIILVSVLYSVSVLYHQAMTFLSLRLAYYVITTKQQKGIKAATLILFLSGITVLSLYIWATYFVTSELSINSFY